MRTKYKPELDFGDGTMLVSDRITGEFLIVSTKLYYER